MTTPPAPTLTGREIAIAATATRAVLDQLLEDLDTPFTSWLVVNLLADVGHLPAGEVIGQLVLNLRIPDAEADGAVDAAEAAGLVTRRADALHITEAGAERAKVIRDGSARIVADLYDGIPEDDLVVARRVLDTLTERARAALR